MFLVFVKSILLYHFSVWKFAFWKSVSSMGVQHITAFSCTTRSFGELFCYQI